MRLPLFGCLLLVGLAIGLLFMVFLYGYFKIRHGLSGSSSVRRELPKEARKMGLSPASGTAPFDVPPGYVVRTVVRRQPCGKESVYYVVLPAFDEPCGSSAEGRGR
jgi:hypothetical protein